MLDDDQRFAKKKARGMPSMSLNDDRPRPLADRNQQIGVALAIALSCLVIGFFSYRAGHETGTIEASASEYEQIAKRNALVACSGLRTDAIPNCVYDEISSSRHQEQAEQDLSAQQWMAWWAAWLTVISVATTVISWVALRYLRATFTETAKMTGKTEEATLAMLQANKIADAANQNAVAAVDIQVRSGRPWILGDDFETDRFTNEDGVRGQRYKLKVRNFGQRPAQRLSIYHDFVVVNRDELPQFEADLRRDIISSNGPGSTHWVHPRPILGDEFEWFASGGGMAFLYVFCEYEDPAIPGEKLTTEMCYRIIPSPSRYDDGQPVVIMHPFGPQNQIT